MSGNRVAPLLSRSVTIAWLALAVAPPPAAAQPRHIEFQLQAEKIILLVRNRLLGVALSRCAENLQLPLPNLGNVSYVLDHMEFPNEPNGDRPTLRWDAEQTWWPPQNPNFPLEPAGPYQINRLQIVVPVDLFLETPECVDCLDPAPCAPAVPPVLRIDAVFDLMADLKDGDPRFCARFRGLEVAGAPTELSEEQLDDLGVPDSVCQKIGLGPLRRFLGESPITNVGVTAGNDFTRLAYRIEVGGQTWPNAQPDPAWPGFLAGQIGPGLALMPERDWTMWIDDALFVGSINRQFAVDNVDEDGDGAVDEDPNDDADNDGDGETDEDGEWPDFERETGPETTWLPLGGAGGAVAISFAGEADPAQKFPLLEVCPTFGVDVTAHVDFSVNANHPDTLQGQGTVTTDVDEDDVVACTLLIGVANTPDVLSALAWISGTLASDALSFVDIGDFLPGYCNKTADAEFQCSYGVELPDFGSAALTLDKMVGIAEGPVFGGWSSLGTMPFGPMSAESDGFSYGVQGGCQQSAPGSGAGPWPYIGYQCYLAISGSGTLCDIEIRDDPLGMFGLVPVTLSTGGGSLATYAVTFPPGPDWNPNYDLYFQRPYHYPFKASIRTTSGAQCLVIPAPEKGDPQAFETQLLIAQADCIPSQFIEPWGAFDPMWHTDPPPFDVLVQAVVGDPLVGERWGAMRIHGLDTTVIDPGTTTVAPGGGLLFRDVVLGLQVAAELDPCSIVPCDGGPAPSAPQAPGGALTLAPAARSPLRLRIPVRLRTDLATPRVDPGLRAALAPAKLVSVPVELPPTARPAGVRKLTFYLTLDPARLGFRATLRDTRPHGGPG